MARNLNSLTITDPVSDPNIDEGNSFTFGVTPGFAGGGGVNAYDLDFQWDQGTATWVTIASTGGLSTADTNPISSTTSTVEVPITVDANTAGSYSIRVVNTSRTITSGTQAITVALPAADQTATGAPEIILLEAAGTAKEIKTPTGAPEIPLPTSAGTAKII